MATLKGIFPNPKPTRRKNFIHENVKNLRRMEQFFHNKEVDEFQKIQLQKKSIDKYQNVASRINSSIRSGKHNALGKPALRHSDKNLAYDAHELERKVSAPIAGSNPDQRKIRRSPVKLNLSDKSKKEERLRTEKSTNAKKASSNPDLFQNASPISNARDKDSVMYRNQGIQTLDSDDMETLYREGVIRYPSGRSSKYDESPIRNNEKSGRRQTASSPSDRGDASTTNSHRQTIDRTNLSPVNGDQIDDAKANKQKVSIASKLATQLNNGVPPTNYRKGVVPKYIRDRKEALLQRDEKLKAAASHPDCPDGHVPLPDEERKETLRMLKKHHQEFVNELNMMPIKTDTLRSQRRKMEIEKQLNKLEEGIKVFSRPKVYVKINA